jgi:hypothetical protein
MLVLFTIEQVLHRLLERLQGGHQIVGRINAKLRMFHEGGPTKIISRKLITPIPTRKKDAIEMTRGPTVEAMHKGAYPQLL